MSTPTGTIKQLWIKWKALKLPWRRQWLAGADLSGNTFWEFKDQLNANRFRRIVKHAQSASYADVQVSPQWHQWLRHTRDEPPSIQEQHYDVARQAQMKQLAARADERWNSVPSFLDSPNKQQPAPAIGVNDPGGYAPQTGPGEQEGVRTAVESAGREAAAAQGTPPDDGRFRGGAQEKAKRESPWEQRLPKGGPSESWQPQAWSPGAVQKR